MKLLTLWPAPNLPATNTYGYTVTNTLDTQQEFVRADYNATADWSLIARYMHDRLDSRGEYITGPDGSPGHRFTTGRLAVVEARHAGTRWLFESSYQFSSNRRSRDDVNNTKTSVGIGIPELFPENAADLIPVIQVTGLSPLVGAQRAPRDYVNHTVSGALTLASGAHAIKTGGLIALERLTSNLLSEWTQGFFEFRPSGGSTAFQNFLRGNAGGTCGTACTYSETDIDIANHFRSSRYEIYLQDTWRMHPTVTLDLGLRYALYAPLTDDRDMLFTFSPGAYDPARALAFADLAGDYLILGTGSIFNGIYVAGQDSRTVTLFIRPTGTTCNPASEQHGIRAQRDGSLYGPATARYLNQTQAGMFAENVQYSSYDPFRTDRAVINARLSNPGAGSVVTPYAVETPVTVATSEQLVAPRWQHWNIGVQHASMRAACSTLATSVPAGIICSATWTSTGQRLTSSHPAMAPVRTRSARFSDGSRSSCARPRPRAAFTA